MLVRESCLRGAEGLLLVSISSADEDLPFDLCLEELASSFCSAFFSCLLRLDGGADLRGLDGG